jgi:hypothetical protein
LGKQPTPAAAPSAAKTVKVVWQASVVVLAVIRMIFSKSFESLSERSILSLKTPGALLLSRRSCAYALVLTRLDNVRRFVAPRRRRPST